MFLVEMSQGQIRAMISTSLVAVISQMLLPKNGGGRVAVPEIHDNKPCYIKPN